MGLFFWKDNKKIDAFAFALAEDLYSQVQPEIAVQHFTGAGLDNKKKKRKIEERFRALIGQMHEFCLTHSLGIYGKARLQKTFSDRLLELGYDDAVTHRLVETIVLRNI
ncbi:MAG: hypothetical protein ACR2QS_10375 [Woeseiaceae bacterium]